MKIFLTPAKQGISIDPLEKDSKELLKRRGFPDEHARIIVDETRKSVERMTEPTADTNTEAKKVIELTKPP